MVTAADTGAACRLVLPRLVLAAPASGAGKTTVATGLMGALRARGLRVSPHKVGPDYIDPGYHALATGRPGRNLDAVLCGPQMVAPLLAHGARGADIAVIEGVMGLFDGVTRPEPGQEADHASTAHVARLLDAPVVLVVDAGGAARSVAALVCGFRDFDRRLRLGGVVLNQVGSDRHRELLAEALADTGVPVLGAIPHDAAVHAPSRHLGLVPAAERAAAATAAVEALAALVGRCCDLDALVRLAASAPPLRTTCWDPAEAVAAAAHHAPAPPAGQGAGGSGRQGAGRAAAGGRDGGGRPVRVAVAGGPAFTFGYAEHVELLAAAGAEVVTVDPLRDETLPAGTDALVIGGGFPEEHAAALAANRRLRAQVAALAGAGVPVVAECAGLLYLARSLDGQPMCGVLDVDAVMGPGLTLGYRRAQAVCDSPLAAAGTTVTAHEFHHSRLVVPAASPAGAGPSRGRPARADGRPAGRLPGAAPSASDAPAAMAGLAAASDIPAEAGAAWRVAPDGRLEGFVRGRVHASYLHLHWAGLPFAPVRLLAAARAARAQRPARADRADQ